MAEPTVHAMFERQAVRRPAAVALQHRDHSISYGALENRARWWASLLRERGVVPGDLVGIRLDREPDMVAAMLGVLMAGAGYVPLDPSYPDDRIAYMAEDSAVTLVVTPDLVSPGSVHAKREPSAAVSGDHVAYVLYTSGSTGSPKGVPITHANAVDLLNWAADVFDDDLDRVLASTSICFDCSILEILGPLTHGGTTVLVDSVMDIGARPDGYAVRLLHSVPSIIEELLRADRLPHTVRTAIVGGEALWAGLVDRIYARSSIERLVNLYGPTEFTSYATMAVIGRAGENPTPAAPPIGLPVANTRIYLLDSSDNEVPSGEPGEMCIAGAGLAQGYLRRPALTAERFVPEPNSRRPGRRMYRTGDLGVSGEDGNLHFLGRIDDQVKVRGVRIEPTEVEHALLAHPAVREAVVGTVGANPGPVALVAYLVSDLDEAIGPDVMRAYLRDRVPSPLVPEHYVFLRRLPRLPNGKIDRRRLPAPAPEVSCASAEPSRVPSRLESVLAQLWADAAGIPQIDVDADIFAVGGHSLPALRVRTRASELLGVDLPLRIFFEQPTIARLAVEIERIAPTLASSAGAAGVGAAAAHSTPSELDGRAGGLSPTQLAILERSDRRDAGLVQPLVVRLRGRVDLSALRCATRMLVRRHDILRSVVWSGDHPYWTLVAPPTLAVVDARDLDLAVASAAVHDLVERVWDLRAEPPARLLVVRLADDDHVVAVVLHGMAADAWTVETVSHQVLELYAAAIHGRPMPTVRPVQYADWSAQRLALLKSTAGEMQRRYWRDLLHGAPVLALPGGLRRVADPGPSLQHIFMLDETVVRGLIQLAREESATPYMAAVTALAATLHARTGQPEIMIGCPTSDRLQRDLTTVVGPFMDALALRCDVSGGPTFRELLRRVRAQALAAYANDAVPFVEMAASAPRDASRHPVFQASVVLQQKPSLLDPAYSAELVGRHPIGEVRMETFGDEPPMTALDVELAFFEREGGWEGVMTCRADVVDPDEATAIAAALSDCFATAAGASDMAITTLATGSNRT